MGGGKAYVFNGKNGQVLYTFSSPVAGGSHGQVVSRAGDVDGDGVGDFVVGVPRSGEVGIFNGHVRVISGASGAELFRVIGGFSNDRFGTSCAILDDLSGNGSPDVLVGAPGAVQQRGRCYVYQYDGALGTNYCTANANSTGAAAAISATGTNEVATNDFQLHATGMPANQFGYFLASMTQGFVQPPGSQGNLCLGGQILRFASQIQSSGAGGEFSAAIDLSDFPGPYNGPVLPGQTWSFQGWYRDVNPGQTSNFTDGLEVDFQ